MATSVMNSSSPGLHPIYTPKDKGQARAHKTPSAWPVQDLFSQNPQKVTALLGRIMHDRNKIIQNIDQENPFMAQYQQNDQELRHHIVLHSAGIKGQFKSRGVAEASRSDFIHVICDTAHTYQGRTGAQYDTLFNAANYLLEHKGGRLSRDSRANIDYFLNPIKAKYPIQTIYGKTEATPYAQPVLASETFGNILFRMTPTDDIVFSPVFLHYLNTKQVYVISTFQKQATWATLQDDEMFYGLGYKKLTDCDAVAHYRWLTKSAPPTEFTAYLTRIGYTADREYNTCETREALLAELSKQYWHLGQGVTGAHMPPPVFSSPKKAHLPPPPIKMQHMGTSPIPHLYTHVVRTESESPAPSESEMRSMSWDRSRTGYDSSDDLHLNTRRRAHSDGDLHAKAAGWERVRGSKNITKIYHVHHYPGAPRSNAATKDIQVELPRAEAAYPKRRYHPPIQTALHASHAAWKHPHQHYIPQAVHIPSVTPKPVYLDVTPVKNCYYWIPADTPKVEKSLRYKFWSFCSKVIDNIRYS